MKRRSILFLFSIFLFPLAIHAQDRGIGAAALILDDSLGHLVTIEAPRNPSNEWKQWQSTGFTHLTWSMPVPPANNAQAGFLFSGPLTGSTVPQVAYWLPPHQNSTSGDGNNGGFAGAWDYAGKGQLGIVSGTGSPKTIPLWNAGDTSVGNSSITDSGSSSSGIWTSEAVNLKCTTESGSGLHSDYNFLNFIDATGSNRGSVQGEDLDDLTSNNVYTYNQDINYFNIATTIANLVLAVAAIAAAFLPTELPIAIINSVQAVLSVASSATSIAGYYIADASTRSSLGIAYTSQSGDYAEYLRRADTSEHLSPGDIVGVTNGLITKKTVGAQNILSISRAPIVLGNTPPKGEETYFDKVGFLGQVPVKVRGEVNAGDFIVPSGFEDGTGIAIAPDAITPDQFTLVVGRAWAGSKFQGIKYITVAAGLNAKSMSEIASREQGEIDSLKEASMLASEKLDLLEQAMLQTDVSKRNALLSEAQQLNASSPFTIAQAQPTMVEQSIVQQGSTQNIAQNTPGQSIAQNVPAQSIAQSVPPSSNSAQNNPPRFTLPKGMGKPSFAHQPFLSSAQIQQNMASRIKSLTASGSSDSSLVEKVEHLQSFASAQKTVMDNINKIMQSSGSRASKGEQIKQFLLHPDDATNKAIGACAFDAIGLMIPVLNAPSTSTK